MSASIPSRGVGGGVGGEEILVGATYKHAFFYVSFSRSIGNNTITLGNACW